MITNERGHAEHLPSKGQIALSDRSWYNRAGVEKVIGFATFAERLSDPLKRWKLSPIDEAARLH